MSTQTIIQIIEQAQYIVTDDQIEQLARERQEALEMGLRTGGTYLRVLVALTNRDLGPAPSRRRGPLKKEETGRQLATLEAVNSRAYAAVMRAVVTPDIEVSENLSPAESRRRSLERNSRTNYARSAMSTIRAYVVAGQDLRELDVATVTKEQIRTITEKYAPPAPAVTAGRLLKATLRDSERLSDEVEELAAVDPVHAQELLETLLADLTATLDKIKAGEYQQPDQAKAA